METAQKTVIVVDDEAPVLRCLRRELARGGHHVLAATCAAEALELLATTRVDVLITDHRMPGMLGSDLVTEATVAQPWLLKIIVTGSPEEVRPLATSDVLIVSKPWPQNALAALVSSQSCAPPSLDCLFGALPLPALAASPA